MLKALTQHTPFFHFHSSPPPLDWVAVSQKESLHCSNHCSLHLYFAPESTTFQICLMPQWSYNHNLYDLVTLSANVSCTEKSSCKAKLFLCYTVFHYFVRPFMPNSFWSITVSNPQSASHYHFVAAQILFLSLNHITGGKCLIWLNARGQDFSV